MKDDTDIGGVKSAQVPVTGPMLAAALNKRAEHGEQYSVEVWPIGNSSHPYPCVGICAKLSDGQMHAVVVRPDKRPTYENVGMTALEMRSARDALVGWVRSAEAKPESRKR